MRSLSISTATVAAAVALSASRDLAAGPVLKGRVFDGEASSRAVVEARRHGQTYDPALKTAFAGKEVTVDLLDPAGGGKAARSWTATTDESGAFSVDTGLGQWPEKALLVARADLGGLRGHSVYLRASEESQDVHLYPATENAARVSVERIAVAYDIEKPGGTPSLRVRVRVSFGNWGGDLYVGKRSVGAHREVWRVPFPQGAAITANTGPYPGLPGWSLSADGRWLVIDTPIPGILDFDRQGPFEVHYLVPPRQRFIQTYKIPVDADGQRFTAWCQHGEMKLTSEALQSSDTHGYPDPFTQQEDRKYDVLFRSEPLPAGETVALVLTTDNVAIGQPVSLGALKWVGGFILVCVLAMLAGLALGPKGPPPEAVLGSLSGEEVLDRIADLDARFGRGKISERDYHRFREPLLELAAEELHAAAGAPPGTVPAAAGGLPKGARDILRRIDEIERDGITDPARIAERAHLLEALLRALRGEGSRT
ncbi:MAG: hypothetical protein HY721_22635 [Planctomycetes bacterium]|nr:hypothetical protein [Planctomycetota bacterium]